MIYEITFNPDKTITIVYEHEIVNYRAATFSERVISRLIDTFLLILPSYFIPILPAIIYWGWMQSSNNQATIGQQNCKLKIIKENGYSLTFWVAAGRFICFLLIIFLIIGLILSQNSIAIPCGILLTALVFFYSKKNQYFHDRMFKCYVIKEIEVINKQSD